MTLLKQKIEEAKSIAILAHQSEDGDAIGSVFAFYEVLVSMGKKADCFLSCEPEKRLSFLCSDYKLKSDICYDLLIILDCADKGRFSDRSMIFDNAKFSICIDHHKTNTGYADINIIKPEASATGEILFDLFLENEFLLNKKSAMCLYAAICSDSGGFKYQNTTPDTMRKAASLMEYGFDHALISSRLFECETLESVKLKGFVMNNIESYEDGKIQLVWTDEEVLDRFDVSEKEAPELVNIPRSVQGCRVAVELKKRNGEIRLSLRANDETDVSKIAACFGGGGHKKAAGATIEADDMKVAKKMVLDKIKEVI